MHGTIRCSTLVLVERLGMKILIYKHSSLFRMRANDEEEKVM